MPALLFVSLPGLNCLSLSNVCRTNSDKELVGKLTTAGHNLFVQGYSEADQLMFSATLALEVRYSDVFVCVCKCVRMCIYIHMLYEYVCGCMSVSVGESYCKCVHSSCGCCFHSCTVHPA